MSDRLGSHWRWRWVLAALLLGLLWYGNTVAKQWDFKRLVPSHTPPAVLRVGHRSGEILEAYDWTTGKSFQIASLGPEKRFGETDRSICVSGDIVAWQRGQQLHVVDIQPPHQERVFEVSLDPSKYSLVGFSENQRFAVYQAYADLRTDTAGNTSVSFERGVRKQRPICLRATVDLRTEKLLETHQWESATFPGDRPGEFESVRSARTTLDPNEPVFAKWALSNEGEWRQIDTTKPKRPYHIYMTKNDRGGVRLSGEAIAPSPETIKLEVLRSSPSGQRYLAYDPTIESHVFVDLASNVVRPVETPLQLYTQAGFLDDDTIALTDIPDDLRLIDASSGRLIAKESSGSQRRGQLIIVAFGIALVAAMWVALAFFERELFWTLTDALLATVTVQFAVVAVHVGLLRPHIEGLAASKRLLEFDAPYFLVLAMVAGTANLVGWYWSHGRGWLLVRWVAGLGWLSLSVIPANVMLHFIDPEGEKVVEFVGAVLTGVIFASLVSFVVVVCRTFRWTIYHAPVQENPSWWGWAWCLFVLAEACILIVIFLSFVSELREREVLPIVVGAFAVQAASTALVAVLFSRGSGVFQWCGWALVVAAIVAGAPAMIFLIPTEFQVWAQFVLAAMVIAGFSIAVTIPCLVLRIRGWHWVRLEKAASPTEPAPNPQADLAEAVA
jgi:hypothetical protein